MSQGRDPGRRPFGGRSGAPQVFTQRGWSASAKLPRTRKARGANDRQQLDREEKIDQSSPPPPASGRSEDGG
eukprot:2694525-Lingulodinium_polyedra.AAC.1